MPGLYEDLLSEIKKIPVIDTHEHLEMEYSRINRPIDFISLFMLHYASCDLVSAGMSLQDMDKLKGSKLDIHQKWQIFKPFWDKARNTVYCRSLLLAARDIYGIDDINDSTYEELNARLLSMNKRGLYKHILKELCNIETSICDVYGSEPFMLDAEFYRPVARFDDFVQVRSWENIKRHERMHDRAVYNLLDWIKLMQDTMKEYKEKYRICGIKSGLAYNRILRYERVSFSEADSIFNKLYAMKDISDAVESHSVVCTKPLEDYIMHRVVQTAMELNLPIQIHTGLQEGNRNIITNSNPVHLINLFMDYPRAKFDIFHGGYPYGGELSAIAKNFSNVYIDMCWVHIISREYSVRWLEEWLDAVPANKIFGFGGDYIFVEGIYGHLTIARENIAKALAHKVKEGYMTEKQCINIAQRLLFNNPKEFFDL